MLNIKPLANKEKETSTNVKQPQVENASTVTDNLSELEE